MTQRTLSNNAPVSALWRILARSPSSARNCLGLLLAICVALGCTTAKVEFVRKTPITAESHQSILLVALTESPLEIEAEECITESVRNAIPRVRILHRDEFRRAVFYYSYPQSGEEAARYFTSLATHPVIKARISELGVRYAVSIQGGTEQQVRPIVGGFAGPGAAVTVIGADWTRKSHLEATIFDFQEVTDAGTIRSRAEGEPWFICVGLGPFCAPMGAAAFTETKACSGLGSAVATFLTGGNPVDAAAASTGESVGKRATSE